MTRAQAAPDQGLALDAAGALRGRVRRAAEPVTGSRGAAFTLLGQEALLWNRNHRLAWRRELARPARLEDLLRE